VSARVREDDEGEGTHETEYDLLTAALIGLTIGAGLTYMLRRGPSGGRPLSPVLRGVGSGARWAGRRAAAASMMGARWAADHGEDLWDRIPRDAIRKEMREYVGRAREAIDDVVESELRDLRRAIRRQRKRLGI
jgi:hypothetical protein